MYLPTPLPLDDTLHTSRGFETSPQLTGIHLSTLGGIRFRSTWSHAQVVWAGVASLAGIQKQ
jgi:hypothetical protein